jgi:molybdenum cofactor cytidylyltransferase
VRACQFDQQLLALGAASEPVRSSVDLGTVEVIDNPQYSTGCGSSIGAALPALDDRADGLVLLLGDQPGISASDLARLTADATSPMTVCRYDNSLGHPMWFGREMFAELSQLHADKAVWKLVHSRQHDLREVPLEGAVPVDLDSWQDYEALLADDESRTQDQSRTNR